MSINIKNDVFFRSYRMSDKNFVELIVECSVKCETALRSNVLITPVVAGRPYFRLIALAVRHPHPCARFIYFHLNGITFCMCTLCTFAYTSLPLYKLKYKYASITKSMNLFICLQFHNGDKLMHDFNVTLFFRIYEIQMRRVQFTILQ